MKFIIFLLSFQLFSYGLEALMEVGALGDLDSARAIKSTLASYLTIDEIKREDFQSLGEKMHAYQHWLNEVALQQSTRSIGLLLKTLSNLWSKEVK